jgi:hypothetical protein
MMGVTRVPGASRAVKAASADSSVHPHGDALDRLPGKQMVAYPRGVQPHGLGVLRTTRTCAQAGIWPAPSETDIGSIIPIRTPTP